MNARCWVGLAALGLMALAPTVARAALDVEVWTGRGDDAVYLPGDVLEVNARASEDAYLLVYEIDSEGLVRMLYPYRGGTGFIEGRRTYAVPPERSNVELVVSEGPVGQCYIVAIASRDRFRELPWYLRPYDMQAEQVGYQGMRDDEEGITSEGRIVGDPFVAMERIRRRVVASPDSGDVFATGYTTYYVHEQVRYPRYLCYDCHRPGRWDWWAGFDPYYTHCSVFDFRINWGWGWGPAYWYGAVPYYCYVVRHDCPPYYLPYYGNNIWFSSWDGWRRWGSMWGDHLVRFKSDPPAGYVPPSRYPDARGGARPPGFIATDVRKGSEGFRPRMMTGRGYEATRNETAPRGERTRGSSGRISARPGAERAPAHEAGDRYEGSRGTTAGERRERSASPPPRVIRPRNEGSRDGASHGTARRGEARRDKGAEAAPAQAPRGEGRADPAPSYTPRQSPGGGARPAPSSGMGRAGASRPRG